MCVCVCFVLCVCWCVPLYFPNLVIEDPLSALYSVGSFENDITGTWLQGFHLSPSFSLFPSLPRWAFSTVLITCSLWLLRKRWQTGQQPSEAACFPALSPGFHHRAGYWALCSRRRPTWHTCVWRCRFWTGFFLLFMLKNQPIFSW